MHSKHLRRLLAVAAAAALVLPAVAVPAQAEDLPPPTIRPSQTRPSQTRPSASREVPSRTRAPRPTPRRTTATRSVAAVPVAPSRAPAAAPRREDTSGRSWRFRREPAPVASPGHVANPRARPAEPAKVASTRTPAAPSEPIAWQARKRHSTYVPPAGATARGTDRSLAERATAVPAAPRATTSSRATTARAEAPRRSTTTRSRATTPRPATAAVPRRDLEAPDVRRASPSYADLERTRATHVAARQPASTTAAHKRRTPTRRSTATRRSTSASRSTAVPFRAGEQAQPVPSTRQPLLLRPRPGCSGDG